MMNFFRELLDATQETCKGADSGFDDDLPQHVFARTYFFQPLNLARYSFT